MKSGLFVLLTSACLSVGPALAADAVQASSPAGSSSSFLGGIDWHVVPRLSVTAGIGYMTATSGEFVYDTPGSGGKISQLNWKIENALIAKGAVSVGLTDWLSASIGGWTHISSDNVMDDYDWLVPPYRQWSDHSHSPDTDLDNATQGDLSMAARVFNNDVFAVRAVAGYQWTQLKWRAYGGHFVYSDVGFRDLVGDFPAGELGIVYSQNYSAPYLGLSANYILNDDWQLNAAVKGSPWVSAASDIDHHVLRLLIFHDKSDQSHLLALSAGATYRLSDRAQLGGTLEYQSYSLGKGPTTVLDQTTGITSLFPGNAAGLDNKMFTASVDIRYDFEP